MILFFANGVDSTCQWQRKARACHQLTCGELSAAFPVGLCARSRKLAQVDLDLLCCALAEKSIRDLPED